MIGFWDIIGRSESGPLVKEKEFDLRVGQVARQMIEKYDIKYDKIFIRWSLFMLQKFF